MKFPIFPSFFHIIGKIKSNLNQIYTNAGLFKRKPITGMGWVALLHYYMSWFSLILAW